MIRVAAGGVALPLLLGMPTLAFDGDTLCTGRSITGPVTDVRDGDTIEVLADPTGRGSRETGGAKAAAAMRQLVSGHELRCELNDA